MFGSLLTINGGSSSIKFALFAPRQPPRRVMSGEIERIGSGQQNAKLSAKDASGKSLGEQSIAAGDHAEAVQQLIAWLRQHVGKDQIAAIGHRIVHGGDRFVDSQRVTEEMLAELRRLSPLDPAHLPGEIALLEAFAEQFSGVPQIACFDTAFHRDLPRVARILPVPRKYEAQGVRRYGFHGISFAYLLGELARVAGAQAARGRVILAHLGAGASLSAVRDGRSIDTSMAMTPTAGLVMATRTGDLDPGLLVYLMRSQDLSVDQIDEMVNARSGLLGISETSADMRDLLARAAGDPRAAEAVDVFCYQARKWIGSMAAALEGLDTLVFSAGIGAHSPEVRSRICCGLEHLGVRLDPTRNAAGEAIISSNDSQVGVHVMSTDEEMFIAREILRVLAHR